MLLKKMKKRIVSLMMCASVFISFGVTNVYATETVKDNVKENDTITTFKANLFDYDRDTMNTATLKLVADKIMKSNVDNQLSVEELQELYPALLFNNAGKVGNTSASYTIKVPKQIEEEILVEEKESVEENFAESSTEAVTETAASTEVSTKTADMEAENVEKEEPTEATTESADDTEEADEKIHTKIEKVTKTVEKEETYSIRSTDYTRTAATDYNNNNSRRGGKPTAYQGLVKDNLLNGIPQFNVNTVDLFNVGDSSNKIVFPDMDVDFVYEDGYYVLDSDKYSYSKNGNHIVASNTGTKGFFPLGEKNFWFGMDVAVDFLMPENGQYNGKDCVFEFSGDDDVWVFIDGKLALDLGGIHAACGGTINFVSQTVSYSCSVNKNGTIYAPGRTVSFSSLGLNVCDNDIHRLEVFYLERGASVSNCKIKFNMPTVNNDLDTDVTFTKKSINDESLLANAGFTLYSDYNCTNVLDKQYSDENGKVTFKNLKTGTYYLKETDVPLGYEESDEIYIIQVAGNSKETLTVVITDSKGNVLEDNIIYNTPKTPQVSLDKQVKLKSWTNRTYNITLFVDAKITKESSSGTVIESKTENGDVIDYIDNRFELCSEQDIEKLGGTVGRDDKGVFVKWKHVNLDNWKVTFPIRAKDNYMGGNYITTNGKDSGAIIKDELYRFDEKRVNVRINYTPEEVTDTIFLGQSLEKYFTDEKAKQIFDIGNYDVSDVNVKYSWNNGSKEVYGSLKEFKKYVRQQAPEEDTVYELNIHVIPKVLDSSSEAQMAAESMKNADKILYTATMQSGYDKGSDDGVCKVGKYIVHVIDGEITITKHFDAEFLDNIGYTDEEKRAVDARQSVIYTVYRYEEDANDKDILSGKLEPIEEYELVITGDGSRTIAGMRAGKYKVVEETSWSWKYILESVEDSYEKSSDGIVYLGIKDDGVQYAHQDVKYTNNLNRAKEWLADTTNLVNKFVK